MTDLHDSTGNIKDDTPGPQTPGQMVRAQREAAGLSLQAVSEALHLTVHYIKSLESDEYNKLPGLTFVKGYFRAYARYLRMDVDDVLASYERYLAGSSFRQHTHDFSSGSASIGAIGGRRSDQSFAWALVAGVILVIALAAGWWFFGREMDVALSSNATTSTPASALTSTTNATSQTASQSLTTQPLVQSNNTAGLTSTPSATPPATQPTTASTFPQSVAATVTQSPPPVVSATVMEGDAQAAAADAGAAVINATLEARQEVALQANAAQLAADQLAASAGDGLSPAAPVASATNVAAPVSDASATALGSYSAPVANAAATTAVALNDAMQTVVVNAVADADGIDNPAAEITSGTSGTRNITLRGAGNDRLEIQLNGASWAEIRDADGADVFSDMLRQGDRLSIEGTAPFSVLLGDARQAQTSFNAQAIDMSSLVRSDNTARFRLGVEGVTAILRDQTVVTE